MEISRLIVVLAIWFAIRYFLNRRNSNPAATMPHGKVIEADKYTYLPANPPPQKASTSNSYIQNSLVAFKALTSTGPVVVDFFATWCGPCKAIAPTIGKLSETYPNVRFIQVDVDKVRDVASQLQVRAMPTFVLFKDGKELEKRVVGGNVKELEEMIKTISA
ncbi:hypothetical protein AOCH_002522 [Aspergillus ochraceoroseus]|uniref:Thioredoxin domain-containing protein n=1 Tax=Aspergillus ochraceoroseus TaxID=138278 RepID=A0A0F8X8H9_9EURO|nr:hypothetical protein AOCH_002522 [Aspergillus ochraceoroseus]